jgi:hypothetical protein
MMIWSIRPSSFDAALDLLDAAYDFILNSRNPAFVT